MKMKSLFLVFAVLSMGIMTGCSKQASEVTHAWPYTAFPADGRTLVASETIVFEAKDSSGGWHSFSPYSGGVTGSTACIDDATMGTWYCFTSLITIPSAYVYSGAGSTCEATYRMKNANGDVLSAFPAADGDYGADCFDYYKQNVDTGADYTDFIDIVEYCSGVGEIHITHLACSAP